MWNRANALIFGVDPRQSLRVHRFFHAAGVYLACVVLLCLGVATGLSDTRNAVQLVAYLVTGLSCFYIAIRSGFNLRFADPALTIPQMAFGATAIAAAYLAVPSARSMTTMLTCLVLVYGAFTLTPRNCRRLGWFCVLTHIFAYVFSGATLADALVPSVQGFHILLSVFIIIVIGDLAAQLSVVRLGLRAQKIALREMLAQVEKMATHDELTGLPNRRQVLDLLAHEERRSHRKNHPPCVAVIDIDHFKRVNDTKGHQAGDETLRQFARIMLETLRTGDVLARWGGEEFLLLLPDTPLDEAVQVMQRLRERCAAPGQWGEWHHLQVSFSAGIAALQPDETTQSAIARADAALYAAKHAGRNQVQVAH